MNDKSTSGPIIADPEQVWKEVDKKSTPKDFDFPSDIYYVSTHGNVVSMHSGKPNLLAKIKKGKYLSTTFANKGNKCQARMNRLACITFHDFSEDERKTQVDHKDTNPHNNHIDNLQWLSPQENNQKKETQEVNKVIQITNHSNMHQIGRIMFMSAILISLNMQPVVKLEL